MRSTVYITGNFPPPFNGQTLATQRLADLLLPFHDVRRVDTSAPDAGYVTAEVRLRPARVRHYLGLRRRLRDAFREAPQAPVLWAAISPTPLGHWRDLLTMLPAFRPGQAVYGVIHWGAFDRAFRSPLTAPTARRLVRRLAGFVFLNEALSEQCAPWIPPQQRFVIPNTISQQVLCTEAEIAAKQRDRQGRARLRLLFLSNMLPEKGYLDVLEAVRQLHAGGTPVEATFAGGWVADADRTAFEAFVARHGLAGVVAHLGPVHDRAQIKRLHREADVFLLPTYYPTEAQPVSILEALNAATPVVTTRHSGIPEMVRQGQEALFVPAHAPEAVAEAVASLADYGRWRMLSDGAVRRFRTRFSPEIVRQQWQHLIVSGGAPG